MLTANGVELFFGTLLPVLIPPTTELQAVPRRQMDAPCRRFIDPFDSTRPQRSNDQPKPSDCDSKRIDVYAPNTIKRLLCGDDLVVLLLNPQSKQTSERSNSGLAPW